MFCSTGHEDKGNEQWDHEIRSTPSDLSMTLIQEHVVAFVPDGNFVYPGLGSAVVKGKRPVRIGHTAKRLHYVGMRPIGHVKRQREIRERRIRRVSRFLTEAVKL